MLNEALSNADTLRYFLSSCPSETLEKMAHGFGNMAWAGIAEGTQLARDSAINSLGFMAITGITLVLAKNTPFNKPRAILFSLSLVTSAVAMINLYRQAMQLQAFSNGWDSQYPDTNLSAIIDFCNKV